MGRLPYYVPVEEHGLLKVGDTILVRDISKTDSIPEHTKVSEVIMTDNGYGYFMETFLENGGELLMNGKQLYK